MKPSVFTLLAAAGTGSAFGFMSSCNFLWFGLLGQLPDGDIAEASVAYSCKAGDGGEKCTALRLNDCLTVFDGELRGKEPPEMQL